MIMLQQPLNGREVPPLPRKTAPGVAYPAGNLHTYRNAAMEQASLPRRAEQRPDEIIDRCVKGHDAEAVIIDRLFLRFAILNKVFGGKTASQGGVGIVAVRLDRHIAATYIEIGGAPCGESVCRYVSIAVVEV